MALPGSLRSAPGQIRNSDAEKEEGKMGYGRNQKKRQHYDSIVTVQVSIPERIDNLNWRKEYVVERFAWTRHRWGGIPFQSLRCTYNVW